MNLIYFLLILICISSAKGVSRINERVKGSSVTSNIRKISNSKSNLGVKLLNIALTGYSSSLNAGYVFTKERFGVLSKESDDDVRGFKIVYSYTLNATAGDYLMQDIYLMQQSSYIYLNSTEAKTYNITKNCPLVNYSISFLDGIKSCAAFKELASSLRSKLPIPRSISISSQDNTNSWILNFDDTTIELTDIYNTNGIKDEIAIYLIDKMQTKTFPVISDYKVGFISQNIDDDLTRRYIEVLYERNDYAFFIDYKKEKYNIEQSMSSNQFIFENKGNCSLVSDKVPFIAFEKSGNIVFSLKENKWSRLFPFEDVIKYYDLSDTNAFVSYFENLYSMLTEEFDRRFIEFTNIQPSSSSSPDKDSKRRMTGNRQFQYSEVSKSNEYKGYFYLDNTFVFIIQKNLDDSAARQENVYKLQLTTTISDKTKKFQLSREILDNKASGIELPKDKVSEYKCESTAFMSLEDISTKCADAVDYVDSLIKEYSGYKFLLDDGKSVSVENSEAQTTKITFQNYSIPESVDFTQFITNTITKNTERVSDSFSLFDFEQNLKMYYIDGVFIIPENNMNIYGSIYHTVKKPEESTESYMKCDSTYYYGRKDATNDNNVMIYTNTKFPFLNTKYLNGSLYVKTNNNTVYEMFKNDRDIIHNIIIDVLNSITPIPNPNPTTTPNPTYTPTPTKTIDIFESNGFIFYNSNEAITYYLFNGSLVVLQRKITPDIKFFKVEYNYDYIYDYDYYDYKLIFDNFTIIEDKSCFYFTENEITEFNKNAECKVEHKEYTYKEIKDLCDKAKKAVEDIIKNVNLPISLYYSTLYFNNEEYLNKGKENKAEDLRYIVDNYHYKSYPVDPSLLNNFKYKYNSVELSTPFFEAHLSIQNGPAFGLNTEYRKTMYVMYDNRTEIVPTGKSYSKLNPDDDIYLVDYSRYCYADCYYYEIKRSIKKEQVLKLFEESFRNNFTNKLSDYLNQTFDDVSTSAIDYDNIKSRNLDNTNEFYEEITFPYNNYIVYIGLFTNEKQLVLIIHEQKEQENRSSIFQMKYVIDNFNLITINTATVNQELSGVELSYKQSKEYNCVRSFISLKDLKTKCPKANDEILNMIKTNITTLDYEIDRYGSSSFIFNRTDSLYPYTLYMRRNNNKESIFTDIIPKITINVENIPENTSFSVPSQLYKFGKKICEICPSDYYNLMCYEYQHDGFYFTSRCDSYMFYYKYPKSNKIYASHAPYFPSRQYFSDGNNEYQYSSEDEESVKTNLKNVHTINMNKVYDDIYDGIKNTNGKLIKSYNMSLNSNELFLFTSNECSIIYREEDNRMVKIVYQYKLHGDITLFTFDDVNLDETNTMFYFTNKQITEERIAKGCVDADKEYSYSELKTKICIKPVIDKYLKAYGKPVFYINVYIYFQYNYVYLSTYSMKYFSESEVKYLIENIHSKTYPVPKKYIQGSIVDNNRYYILTSKSFIEFELDDDYVSALPTEINITESDNSTYFIDYDKYVHEFYYLSEKHDKVFMRIRYENRYNNEGVYDIYINNANGKFYVEGDMTFTIKLENEIKSKYTANKAFLDERIQNNTGYGDDDDRRILSLNSNYGRILQDNKKGYYYEYWNSSVMNLISEDHYDGYYYGFFITEDKFIYVNHKSADLDFEKPQLFGIKLVSKINSQDNFKITFSDDNIILEESRIELSDKMIYYYECSSSVISLNNMDKESKKCLDFIHLQVDRSKSLNFEITNKQLTLKSGYLNINKIALKEIELSKLLDTLNTITINVESLPSDKSFHEAFNLSTTDFDYYGDDIKINNTFIEFTYGKLYSIKRTVFIIALRKDIATYVPIQYYAVKDKYYTSTGLPIYRSFFDNNGKDYATNVDKIMEDYNNIYNAHRDNFINLVVSELDGPVQPTIDASKKPVRIDYMLQFCYPANMEIPTNQPNDNEVISTINTYMTNYLLAKEIIFYNMTVEKVNTAMLLFNISYEVYPDVSGNASILNGKIVDDYEFFESIYEISGKVYDTCNPPYTECRYNKPDYLFEANSNSNDVLVIAPESKTQSQDIKYETRCSRAEIIKMDGGSFQIPNKELQLSVCRISCSSERHSNKSTSFTVRVKPKIDYIPSIAKISKPVMVNVNQAFTIEIAVACPVVDRSYIKPELNDVTMTLNWDIKDGDKSKYMLASDSKTSDRQEVSTLCERTFAFVVNVTSNEGESSTGIKNIMNITITSDKYDLMYQTEFTLIKERCSNPDEMGVCCKHQPGELCTNMTTTFSFITVEKNEKSKSFKDSFIRVLDSVLFNNSHFWYTDIPNEQDQTNENQDEIEIKLTIKTNTILINTIPQPKRMLQDIPDISEFFGELTDKIDSIASNDVQEVSVLLEEAGTVLDPDKAITTESTLGITALPDDPDPSDKLSDNKSWAEKYWYVILIIVVVAVVLLSIIGVITYRAVDKTKVSRIEKKQLEICEKVIPIEKVKEQQGVSENDIYHPYEKTIILEGYLMKEGKAGYQRRYCVLYYNPSEMKLYESMTPSYYGNVYVGEKQSYKMESLNEVKYEEGSNQFNAIFKVNESAIKNFDNGENIRNIHFKVCKCEGENENEIAKRWVEAFESYISGKPTVKSAWLVPVPLVRDQNLDGKLVTENSNVVGSRIMDTVVRKRANRKLIRGKKEVLKSSQN